MHEIRNNIIIKIMLVHLHNALNLFVYSRAESLEQMKTRKLSDKMCISKWRLNTMNSDCKIVRKVAHV